jgi:hypothetical protein
MLQNAGKPFKIIGIHGIYTLEVIFVVCDSFMYVGGRTGSTCPYGLAPAHVCRSVLQYTVLLPLTSAAPLRVPAILFKRL